MMNKAAKLIRKLRKPPAVHNWVRSIRLRQDDTAQALYEFAINPPRTSLLSVVKICQQIVFDQISLKTALRCVDSLKQPELRDRASWIVRAFHSHVQSSGLKGIQVFDGMVEHFPVAAGVRVPVRPSFVTNDAGKLVPVFLICWTRMVLSHYQIRVLTTLIDKTILSLEEFEGSHAMILCTPLAPYCKKERQVVSWKTSDYEPLNNEELQELFDRYAAALDDADRMLIEMLG